MKEQFLVEKKKLISQLKKDFNYSDKYSFFIKTIFAIYIIMLVGMLIYNAVVENSPILIVLIIFTVGIFILELILFLLDQKLNAKYNNIRNGIAEVEVAINQGSEIPENVKELYDKYKSYFEVYKNYIIEIRK